ncbi:MAG: undecaprenyl/decaprenyl-phosphate alpha-N-acetylglucosaminyl 1-phosphate transferase [Armatimonadetes bacterium]|nr:undecaprenyl/decaprenyl-phosphate alpha-N-acetylglucosaminyl 1-phosphate transferase [Armatimonadota bacterium]
MRTYTTVLAALISLLIALIFTPLIRTLAIRLGIVAHPGGRRVHARATPLLGGVAMYLAFTLAVVLAIIYDHGLTFDRQVVGILLGGTFVAIVGVLDDKYELPGWVQAAALVLGGVVLFLFGVKVHYITNPFKGGWLLSLGYFTAPITILWVLMVTKAVDCMDGLDGLAAGISAIAAATLMMMIRSIHGEPGLGYRVSNIMAAALMGAALGFLRSNYPPAKIFMGTVGAQFLGFMLAAISIVGAFKLTTLVAIAAPVLVLGVPLFDTTFVVLRRVVTGKRIHEADTSHLHHRLVDKGLSHRQVIWFIYALTLVLCAAAYILFVYAK